MKEVKTQYATSGDWCYEQFIPVKNNLAYRVKISDMRIYQYKQKRDSKGGGSK